MFARPVSQENDENMARKPFEKLEISVMLGRATVSQKPIFNKNAEFVPIFFEHKIYVFYLYLLLF